MTFSGIIAKAIAEAQKLKADLAKVATDVDLAVAKISADAPEVEALANAVIPGASTYIDIGASLLEAVAEILDKGDAAAEQNLLNAGLDQSLIATVKSQLANIKKLV